MKSVNLRFVAIAFFASLVAAGVAVASSYQVTFETTDCNDDTRRYNRWCR